MVSTQERWKTFTARTREDAVSEAVDKFDAKGEEDLLVREMPEKTGVFSRLFGKKVSIKAVLKKEEIQHRLEEILSGIISHAGLDATYDVELGGSGIDINFSGRDKSMFMRRNGELLDAFQYLVSKILYTDGFRGLRIRTDCGRFRDDSMRKLENELKKARSSVLKGGRPAYMGPLNPYKRRFIHSFLNNDDRVFSRSLGNGHYKRIKIALRDTEL